MSGVSRRLRSGVRRMLTKQVAIQKPNATRTAVETVATIQGSIQPYRAKRAMATPRVDDGQQSALPSHVAYLDYATFPSDLLKANNFSLLCQGITYKVLHPPLDTGGEGVMLEVMCNAD